MLADTLAWKCGDTYSDIGWGKVDSLTVVLLGEGGTSHSGIGAVMLTVILAGKGGDVNNDIGRSHRNTNSALRKDFVILQLYWWLFSSTKHCS